MSKELKNIDDLLRENLSQGKINPPDFVWNNIEKKIARKKKKRFLMWFFSASVVGLLGASSYFFNPNNNDPLTKQSLPINEYKRTSELTEKNSLSSNKDKKGIKQSEKEIDKSVTNKRFEAQKLLKNNVEVNLKPVRKNEIDNITFNILPKEKESNTFSKKLEPETAILNEDIFKNIKNEGNNINDTNYSHLQSRNTDNSYYTKTSLDTFSQHELFNQVTDSLNQQTLKSDTLDKPITKTTNALGKWSLSVNSGYSLFDIAIFDDYFTSGAISNRNFASSGFDIDIKTMYKISPFITAYAGINYNRKKSNFNYDVLTDSRSFLLNKFQNVPLSLNQIINNDFGCRCYVIEDVSANYVIFSFSFSTGIQLKLAEIGRLDFSSKIDMGTDLISKLKFINVDKLDLEQEIKASFKVLKVGMGLNVNYELTPSIGILLSPSYQYIITNSLHPFYGKNVRELIVAVGVNYKF